MSVGLALMLASGPMATADAAVPLTPPPIEIAMLADPAPPPVTTAVRAPVAVSPLAAVPPPDAAPPVTPPPITEYHADDGARTPVVVIRRRHAPGDPFEEFNRSSYEFSMAVDKAVLRPVALGYRHVVPRPARDGIRNLLSNIGEPFVFINDLLQLKVGRAFKTLGRFAINSTLGVGGLFDAAKRKPFYLSHHNNSLGDTLGYYGVGPGPYLYLPILGPTTLRDVLAGQAQGMLLPAVSHVPFGLREYQISTNVVGGLDQREQADDDLRTIVQESVDPYATMRSLVLQDRAGEIAGLKSGNLDDATEGSLAIPPDPSLDTPLVDPAAAPPAAAPADPAAPPDPADLPDPAPPPPR